ncbi:MAG: phosphatidylglycerophosphatase A [Pseudobdellovibrionaceae bacterium]|jgi:phosphatidylglycerophosphatase A
MRDFLFKSATFFGLGKISKAPGTLASLATLPIVWALYQAGPFVYMAVVLLLLPLSVVACEIYENTVGSHDNSEVVIDEVLGVLIAMTWVPMTWQALLVGFLLFRVLDIFKPFPIGYLDRKIPGGIGVVVDDVVAGVLTNIALQIMLTQTIWLGVRIG